MRDRSFPLALAAALLLLAAAIAAACGDDNDRQRNPPPTSGVDDPVPTSSGTALPQTMGGYFQDIAGIFADATDEIGEIESTFESDFADANDEADADEVLEDAIKDFQRAIARAARDLSSLRPVTEATSQHNALSASLNRAVTSTDALREDYQAVRGGDEENDVTSAQAALAAQAAEAFALISTELEDACLELQDLAAEQEVETDLICGEEAPAPASSPTPTGSPSPADDPA